jgi:hypothetical protein
MGCQTQLCQYQTDRDDMLLGHDGGFFRGVWIVLLPALDIDWVPSPVSRPKLILNELGGSSSRLGEDLDI